MNKEDRIGVVYLIMALMCFGHSASKPRDYNEKFPTIKAVSRKAVSGFFAGLCWPAYISWEIAEELRKRSASR